MFYIVVETLHSTILSLQLTHFSLQHRWREDGQLKHRTTYLCQGQFQAGLAVCLIDLEHQDLFITTGQLLGPVTKSYVALHL